MTGKKKEQKINIEKILVSGGCAIFLLELRHFCLCFLGFMCPGTRLTKYSCWVFLFSGFFVKTHVPVNTLA